MPKARQVQQKAMHCTEPSHLVMCEHSWCQNTCTDADGVCDQNATCQQTTGSPLQLPSIIAAGATHAAMIFARTHNQTHSSPQHCPKQLHVNLLMIFKALLMSKADHCN